MKAARLTRTPARILVGRTWIFSTGERLPLIAGGDGEEAPTTVPDDLSTIEDDAELDALKEELRAEFKSLIDDGSKDIARLEALAETIEKIDAEVDRRKHEAEEVAAKIAALSERINPASSDDPPDEPDDGGDDPGDGDPPEDGGDGEGAKADKRELVTAAAPAKARPSKASASGTARRAGRPIVEPAKPTVTITAAADVPGVDTGSTMTLDQLGAAMHARARGLSDHSGRVPVATINIPQAEWITDRTSDETVEALLASLADPKRIFLPNGLVAAGGWCAPSQTLFDFVAYDAATGLLDLPSVGIDRGGINVPSYIGIDAADGALWSWSEDQDAVPQLTLTSNVVAGGVGTANTSVPHLLAVGDMVELRGTGLTDGPRTVLSITDADTFTYDATGIANATYGNGQAIRQKSCFEIPCATWTDYRLGAYGLCLKNGNLMSRAMPELDRRFIQLVTNAHAHRMSVINLAKIRTSTHSEAVTITAAGTDSYGEVMSAIELAMKDYRSRYKISANVPFEVLMPEWAPAVLRANLAMRQGVDDMRAITDAQIAAEFAVRKARPQFLEDYTPLYTGSARQVWPTSMELVIYPAGDFVEGNGGTLDLTVQRDSTQNKTNDHTVLWTEDFRLLARRGPKAMRVTVTLSTDGITGCCP